jgi:hypothetical protein
MPLPRNSTKYTKSESVPGRGLAKAVVATVVVAFGARRGSHQREGRFEYVQRAGERGTLVAGRGERPIGGAHAFLALEPVAGAVRECDLREERARVVAEALNGLENPVAGLSIGGCAGRCEPLAIPREVFDPVVADRRAEVLRDDVLELVRFVEDEVGARRDHLAERALADRRVGAQQVMIHDHHVGGGRLLAHPRHEALVVARAFGAETGFGSGRDFIPERKILGQVLELGAVAGRRPAGPFPDDGQKDIMHHGAWPERRRGFVQLIEPVQAQIVRTALHVRRGERDVERVAKRREVLEEDLFLEVLRASRDEDTLAAQDGGDEVGQGLPGAGAGFGEEDAAVLEDVGDGRRHLDLAGARFEVGDAACQRAGRREHLGDRRGEFA